jgi:hypothetical protein
MSTEIVVNPDQTVSVIWKGRRGRGSLFQTMASGNADSVNKLDLEEITAVLMSAISAPFPLGHGEKVYREILKSIRDGSSEACKHNIATMKLAGIGKARRLLLFKAGEGCNAPHDSYLRIAVEVKENKEYIESY